MFGNSGCIQEYSEVKFFQTLFQRFNSAFEINWLLNNSAKIILFSRCSTKN